MTYDEFINNYLRVELKDFPRLHKEVFDGDGTTSNFILSHVPVKDNSYLVKVNGVGKSENSDYTINKNTGVITFSSPPSSGSDNVEVFYESVKMRDSDYLEIINDGINHFRWKFWKEATDETTITTVRNQYEYDLSGIEGILYLVRVWYKVYGGDYWKEVQSFTNWKYMTNEKKLYINPPFEEDGLQLKIYYLKEIKKGTSLEDTLDIPSEWLLPFKYYVYARYYERLIPERIHETAAVTTIPTFAPAQLIYDISQKYYGLAEAVAAKIAPRLPTMPIKQIHFGSTL